MLTFPIRAIAGLLLFTAVPLFGQTVKVNEVDITLSGEVRVRSELDARTSDAGTDHATLLRTRLGALAKPSEQVSVFIQLSDSRIFGEESNTLTDATADRLDVHQAWLAWTPQPNLKLTVGRQELAFADERLIGAVNWTNVSRAFDGARLNLKTGGWSLDGFAMSLDEQAALLATGLDPRVNADEDAEDRSLYGFWAANDHFDLFALGDRNATDGPDRMNIDRYTLGARGRTQLGKVALQATGAYQVGNQTQTGIARQNLEGFMASLAANYLLTGPLRGQIGMQVDYLSGDDNPLDDTFGGFNTLYATNHKFYGFMDLFLNLPRQTGDLGLVDVMVRGVLRPDVWTVKADLHHFSLAEENLAGDKAIGVELDLTASRTLASGLGFQAGYSLFSASEAAEISPIGLGENTLHWAYVQLFARF